MTDLRTKFEAVLRLGRHLPQNPDMAFLLGFLSGNLHRLHFVRHLEGAPVAIAVAGGRRFLWPGGAFSATIHSVPVPLPGPLVGALAESDEPICVRVSLDDPADAAWFEPLLVDSFEAVRSGLKSDSLSDRVRGVRRRIDQALDVYRECRRLLDEGRGEDEARLKFFLGVAESEIEGLGQQLSDLNGRLRDRDGLPAGEEPESR